MSKAVIGVVRRSTFAFIGVCGLCICGFVGSAGCGRSDSERSEPELADRASNLQPASQGPDATEKPPHAADGSSTGMPRWEPRCVVPAVPIARPNACARNEEYPRCKWRMPNPASVADGSLFTRWRNTVVEHWWGRPTLVGVVLATASAFRKREPDQPLVVGDLDAPGPRHQTHKSGVDVDLYLPGAMLKENVGGGRYEENYGRNSSTEDAILKQRVLILAQTLARCTDGQLRIYYNDETVRASFLEWFAEEGYQSPFGDPMQTHNELHDFHFHVTIGEALEPLKRAPPPQPDPIAAIPKPPAPTTPALMSRSARALSSDASIEDASSSARSSDAVVATAEDSAVEPETVGDDAPTPNPALDPPAAP